MNNPELELAILGYAAKYAERYNVSLYALAIEGNHIHSPALFPEANRSQFMRDFNSSVARAVPRYCAEFRGGGFWARRYSQEFLPENEDVEEYFFYTVLQPVQDGLVPKISEYPGYNCFHDAVNGVKRKFKVTNWAAYNSAKRFNSSVSIKEFITEVTLQYERLPGYEDLTQKEYSLLMHRKLEERRVQIVQKRKQQGLGFAGREALLKMPSGATPHRTKPAMKIHTDLVYCVSAVRKERSGMNGIFNSIIFSRKPLSASEPVKQRYNSPQACSHHHIPAYHRK
ncbi:MAG: transposase, partial [Bdellovibrionota bacterium]